MTTGKLVPLDMEMSSVRQVLIHHRLGRFVVHPAVIDEIVKEDSYCFGSIRELYIRDCYFRYHQVDPGELKVVVDLGANRGLFSAMCTPFAQRIVAVEPQKEYREAYDYNMQINGFKNYEVVHSFVANKTNAESNNISFDDLCAGAHLTQIDFLKIDIEGAEFALFEHLPLEKIGRLTIEVHREHGDPQYLLRKLKSMQFHVTSCDSAFRTTDDPAYIDYIYAERSKS